MKKKRKLTRFLSILYFLDGPFRNHSFTRKREAHVNPAEETENER